MQRWIGFLRARGFYAQAHIEACPELASRAFAVVCGREVIDVSPRAEAEGVRRGITTGELRWICPEAATVPYEEVLYLPLHRRLWDTVYARAPVVEPQGLCEGFFDATGCIREDPRPERRRSKPPQQAYGYKRAARTPQQAAGPQCLRETEAELPKETSATRSYVGSRSTAEQWRAELMEAVREATGLAAEVGLGPNRPLAEMAAREGLCLRAGDVKSFLAEAPVNWLPQPPEVIEALRRLGVRRVGEIASLPAGVLRSCLGQAARQVREIACGQGEARVEALYPPPAVTRRTGPIAGADAGEGAEVGRLRELLQRLCAELWAELERRRMRASLLRLTLDPLYGAARSAEERLPVGISGPKGLEQAVWGLWRRLWSGEDLAGAEIELSELNPFAPQQYDLWGQEQRLSSRQTRLERVQACLARRFGQQALQPASKLPPRQRLAEQILARQAQEWAGAA
ncbi:MAG: hypothetical protein N2512_05675 [Armatimonadetes bacterium]|nr:hypothetical protein [Armatimonadota bacterium]